MKDDKYKIDTGMQEDGEFIHDQVNGLTRNRSVCALSLSEKKGTKELTAGKLRLKIPLESFRTWHISCVTPHPEFHCHEEVSLFTALMEQLGASGCWLHVGRYFI